MEKETLYKSRSFSSCIQAAYKLMSDNLKGIVRSTWLPVLILGVSTSLLVTLNIPSPSILEFGISHTALFFTLVGVALLGMILCSVWAMSRLMSMLNEHSRWWNFKRVLIATLNFTAIFIVTYGILVAAFYWGIRYTGGSPAHFVNDNYLVVLAVSLLFILALLPLCYIIMRYLYDPQASFWREFPRTYTTGLRHLGFIFLTALLIGIIVGVVALVVYVPLFILHIANMLSLYGVEMGDPSGLPSYFLPLLFFTTLLVTMVAWYLYFFEALTYLFMYGSIESQEEERRRNDISVPILPPVEEPNLPLQKI